MEGKKKEPSFIPNEVLKLQLPKRMPGMALQTPLFVLFLLELHRCTCLFDCPFFPFVSKAAQGSLGSVLAQQPPQPFRSLL